MKAVCVLLPEFLNVALQKIDMTGIQGLQILVKKLLAQLDIKSGTRVMTIL